MSIADRTSSSETQPDPRRHSNEALRKLKPITHTNKSNWQQTKKMKQSLNSNSYQGFTIVELIVAVAILGTLSAIAIPSYLNQLLITRQKECSAVMSQLLTSTMAFNDEYSQEPTSWADLNTMAAVMKESGTASGDNNFNTINLRNGNYSMSANQSGSIYQFSCVARENGSSDFNVLGCLNLDNGASEIKLGKKGAPATKVDCT